MPLEWMLAVMRDPNAEQSRRDEMAKCAAAFCHPRLGAVLNSGMMSGANGNVDVSVQVLTVPRGAVFDAKSGTVMIDGEVISESELPKVTPFEPTHDWTTTPSLTDQSERTPEPTPVVELDTSNVTVLRRRDDDPPDVV
jgi:hypothetical protein